MNWNNNRKSWFSSLLEFVVIVALRTIVQIFIINIYDSIFQFVLSRVRNTLLAHLISAVILFTIICCVAYIIDINFVFERAYFY